MIGQIKGNPFLDPDEMEQYLVSVSIVLETYFSEAIEQDELGDWLKGLHKHVFHALASVRPINNFMLIIDEVVGKLRDEYRLVEKSNRQKYIPVYLRDLHIKLYNIGFLLHSTYLIRCWLEIARDEAALQEKPFPAVEQILIHLRLYEQHILRACTYSNQYLEAFADKTIYSAC